MDCNMDQNPKLKNKPLSKGIHTLLQQEPPKDLKEEHELGHKIFKLGSNLKLMKITWRVLSKLDELDELLSKVSQLEGKKLIWALKAAMLALIQHKFLEEPCEGVRLPVASCLSNTMRLTAPRSESVV